MLNEITQIFQLDREVHVVHGDVFRHMQNDRSEVENPSHAKTDQRICDFLGGRDWQGKDRHFNAVAFNKLAQFIHPINRLFHRLVTLRGVLIECGNNLETFLFETFIQEQRQTEVADTNQNNRLQTIRSQQIGNHFAELLDIVAKTTSAELAEIGQVFTKLSGFYARRLCQCFAGNRADGVILQPLQTAQINRKPINGFARNFWAGWLFQASLV